MIDELGLTEQERETLLIAQEMHTLSLHNGWRRIRGIMKQWENESLHSLREAKYASSEIRSGLARRWDERCDLNKMLDDYMEAVLQQRKALLAEIALQNGNSPDEAMTMAETL